MKKRALIVDDNSANLYIMESLLKRYGLEVTSAENGKDALDKVRLNPPDLIVSDILMPVMDGYTLCRQWKSDDKLKHIPFVFYTATYTESGNEEFALSLGADRFILKPQKLDILMNILKEVLEENYAVKQVATKPLGEEMEFFRQHNEILFKKLEKKMLDLEIANQKLKILEEKYRLSFENVKDVIYTIDTDLNLLSISPSVERILGYKPEDFIGRPVSDFGNILTPESFEQAVADISLILKSETIPATIYRFIAKDGTIKYGEVSGSPIMRDGKIIGMISVARDITDRKRAEEALKKSENKYRLLADNVNDVIFVLDMNLNYTYISPSVKILRGYEPAEALKQPSFETLTPSSWDLAVRTLSEIMELEKSEHREIPISRTLQLEMRRKDGTTVWTEVKFSFIRDENQRPVGILGVTRDITERKRAEENLKETLDSLRNAVGTTIQVMVSAVESRDPCTAGHQLRSADLARAIATEMGLPQDRIDGIRMAGSIHDIGKLSIPAEILSKPTKLTELEFSLIKEHSRSGYEILKNVESPWPLAQIVYQHHERMNGSGYPRNLKGDDILMEARIMAVSDVVESMASHRPYRPSRGLHAALEEIEKNKGILYDNTVADACLRLFREKGYQLERA